MSSFYFYFIIPLFFEYQTTSFTIQGNDIDALIVGFTEFSPVFLRKWNRNWEDKYWTSHVFSV